MEETVKEKSLTKPLPEQFGYEPAGLEEQGGWMIEGGEEAYQQALEKWNIENSHIADNELIAVFMGNRLSNVYPDVVIMETLEDTPHYHKSRLLYHSDWNWLMPVVKKIADMDFRNSYLPLPAAIAYDVLVGMTVTYPIESVHAATVNFIKKYNNGKSQSI